MFLWIRAHPSGSSVLRREKLDRYLKTICVEIAARDKELALGAVCYTDYALIRRALDLLIAEIFSLQPDSRVRYQRPHALR